VVTGQWLQGSGYWAVVTGQWLQGSGYWTVVSGQWLLGSGYWAVVTRLVGLVQLLIILTSKPQGGGPLHELEYVTNGYLKCSAFAFDCDHTIVFIFLLNSQLSTLLLSLDCEKNTSSTLLCKKSMFVRQCCCLVDTFSLVSVSCPPIPATPQ
jgi:hypothetical protein